MSVNETRHIAYDESGEEYVIVERQVFTTLKTSSGVRRIPGPIDYVLSDGRHVTHLGDNQFRILNDHTIITRIS